MADKKITDLTELTTGQIATDDLVFLYDASLSSLKAAQLSVINEGLVFVNEIWVPANEMVLPTTTPAAALATN